MNKTNLAVILPANLLLSACLHTGQYTGPYTANSPSVLVKPTIKVWEKPGATEEDERIAGRQCGDELRSNEQLRKGPSDAWSAAAHACMQRKGFRHYKKDR